MEHRDPNISQLHGFLNADVFKPTVFQESNWRVIRSCSFERFPRLIEYLLVYAFLFGINTEIDLEEKRSTILKKQYGSGLVH